MSVASVRPLPAPISQVRAVKLCQAIYAPVAPGVFDEVLSINGITVGYKLVNGCSTFTFAGSECKRDWERDFDVVPFHHPLFGMLHSGFWRGMEGVADILPSRITSDRSVSIQGHSLGCPHAAYFAALLIQRGIHVEQLCLFAPPRMSDHVLPELLRKHVGAIYAYRNGFDPVPEWPKAIPFVAPWVEIADLITLTAMPANRWDVFDYHAVQLYVEGVEKLFGMQTSAPCHL